MTLEKILIASGNQGKIKEISALLNQVNITPVTPKDLPEIFANLQDPEETGATFAENSLIKAKFYAQKANLPALADDSGLCIHDLDNQPGIHSARFATNDAGKTDFPTAFTKIFSALAKKGLDPKKDEIRAHFVCNLTLFNPKTNKTQQFEGRINGKLTNPCGKKGFGYDPIFIKNGMNQTFGEIEPQEKDQISHRGDAFQQFLNWLENEQN